MLEQIWKKRKPECLPGSMDDFIQFIGSTKEHLQEMNYMNLNNLHGVIREEIMTCGGYKSDDAFVWRWQYKKTVIEGRGKSYYEAALRGLINCWIISVAREEGQCVQNFLKKKKS